MKKIKAWVEEHKGEIIIYTVIGTAVVAGFTIGRMSKQFVDPYAGKTVLSWIPHGKFISLEEAKKVLDLNGMGEGIYALVQEAPDVFSWIVCNDKFIPLP